MKICSLLPSATEILFALGLGEQVVAVSHECDFPDEARRKPRALSCAVNHDTRSSEEIDRLVRESAARGESLYRLDAALLQRLRPDLIVTQDLCDVCAIDAPSAIKAIATLRPQPEILALHPHTLGDVSEDIRRLGSRTQRASDAARLIKQLRDRLQRVRQRVGDAPRPRVVCLEWLDPPMATGHWVPEMVEAAGGIEVLGEAGARSRRIAWHELIDAAPEVVVMMPCGFSVERTLRELDVVRHAPGWADLPAVRGAGVYAVDASAYFTRPGPRLVDGVEILATLLHPERMAASPAERDRLLQGRCARVLERARD